MKIIATVDSETCLVQISKQELEAITGHSYYSDNSIIKKVFNGGEKPELNLIEPITAIGNLKGIPKEVSTVKKQVEKLLQYLTECENGLKSLPVLSTKVVKV